MSAISFNNVQTNKGNQAAGADEYLTVTNAAAVALSNIPVAANWAVVNFEGDIDSQNLTRCMNYREDGGTPTALLGTGVGDNESRSILTRTNLNNFRVIGIFAGETHTVRVQYFR